MFVRAKTPRSARQYASSSTATRARNPRRWVRVCRRVGHAAAVALLVLLTSTGLIVGQAGGAQALVVVPPILIGSMAMGDGAAMGAGAAAVCATGVGCAVLAAGALAVVGYSLYASRDTWVPWVSGLWGPTDIHPAGTIVFQANPIVVSADQHSWSFGVHRIVTGDGVNMWYTLSSMMDTLCRKPDGTFSNPDQGYQPNVTDVVVPASGADVVVQGGGCGEAGNAASSVVAGARARPYQGANNWMGWYPSWGNQAFNLEASTEYRTTVQCINAAGTVTPLVSTYSGGLGDGGKGGINVPSCEAAGLGHGMSILTEGRLPGQSVWQRVWGTTPVADAAYPLCSPTATTICILSVSVDGVTCVNGASGCTDWSLGRQTQPQRFECHWGPYVVAIAKCNVLERAYLPGGTTLDAPNTDGDPTTQTNPVPPTPTPTPTVTQSVPPTPEPTRPPGTAGVPDPFDPGAVECYPTGWTAFNPAEWVLKPVKCALVWAFVPEVSLQTQWDTNAANFSGTSVGQWYGVVWGWGGSFAAIGAGTGCQGPPVPTGVLGDKHVLAPTIYPFEACSGVKATAAATSRLLLSVIIGWGTAWRLVRIVGRPFGYDLELMNQRSDSA